MLQLLFEMACNSTFECLMAPNSRYCGGLSYITFIKVPYFLPVGLRLAVLTIKININNNNNNTHTLI